MNRGRRRHARRGFSLVEMAVVLVVFALMLTGLLMITGTQLATQRGKDTQRAVAEARQALLGFAAVNGRLPCPAAPNTPAGAPGAGVERPPTNAGCTGGQAGVLPWATLGLPETDAWGRRISYRVSALHSRTVIPRPPAQYGCAVPPATPPAQAAFALCSPGDNEVRVAAAGAPLVTNAPAVLISHGANGFGAWLPTGTQMPPSTDADEQENHDGDAIAVERTPTASFDDIVVVLPASLLAQSMLQAQRLP
jgi:prepilin-type N-terminal cleavage/methylation domain-containing protein